MIKMKFDTSHRGNINDLELIDLQYRRNGVMGYGFYLATIRDNSEHKKMIVTFYPHTINEFNLYTSVISLNADNTIDLKSQWRPELYHDFLVKHPVLKDDLII